MASSQTSSQVEKNAHLVSETSKSEEKEVTENPGVELSEFCSNLDDYTPTIPDAVTLHYLQRAGFNTQDPKVVRLVSLAAQKFISDIANDALTHCKMRTSSQASRKTGKERKYTLTLEDLTPALNEYGINLKKANYFT